MVSNYLYYLHVDGCKSPSRCNSYTNKTRQIYKAAQTLTQLKGKKINGGCDRRWRCFKENQSLSCCKAGARVQTGPGPLTLSPLGFPGDGGLAQAALSLCGGLSLLSLAQHCSNRHPWHQGHGKHSRRRRSPNCMTRQRGQSGLGQPEWMGRELPQHARQVGGERLPGCKPGRAVCTPSAGRQRQEDRKSTVIRSEEPARQLRALPALADGPGWVPSSHMAALLCLLTPITL